MSQTTSQVVGAVLAAAVILAACSASKPAAPPMTAKFDISLPMDELMGHVIDPAAYGYWKGSGVEVTAAGDRDLSPTTEEGWEALESAAAALIEAGNVLQLPGRGRSPDADWNGFAQQLTQRAVAAKAAAQHHVKKAVFDEGGRIYEVCTACHAQYVIGPQLKATGRAQGLPLPPWPKDFPNKK